MNLIIIAISICLVLISLFIALKLTQKDKGEYECEKCKNKFEPTYKEIVLSMYSDDTRYLKCPNCNKKTWCKKV